MASYRKSSAYATTNQFGNFLDVFNNRTIQKKDDDTKMIINAVYHYRPDLLAYDLYGDAGLWWVFAQRNPNILKDPLFDFYAGQLIFVPKKDTLVSTLGL